MVTATFRRYTDYYTTATFTPTATATATATAYGNIYSNPYGNATATATSRLHHATQPPTATPPSLICQTAYSYGDLQSWFFR